MSAFKKTNPAHRILRALGLSHLCGVWEKTKSYHGPTRPDPRTVKKYRYADALREAFTRKQKESMAASRK